MPIGSANVICFLHALSHCKLHPISTLNSSELPSHTHTHLQFQFPYLVSSEFACFNYNCTTASITMSFKQELTSWLSPSAPAIPVASALQISLKAPSDEMLPMPPKDGKPVILTFLRHCGCPCAFAPHFSTSALCPLNCAYDFQIIVKGYFALLMICRS